MFLYYELGRDLQFIFLSRRMHKAQQGFTLIEVVIALTLFSFVIIGIITAVNRAYAYVQQARLNVIAMNLTREGMEMIYNIRDTNRRVWAGLKDGYWLKRDPFTTPSEIMTPGYYSISSNIKNMQVYPMLELQYSLDASAYYDMDNILTDPEVSSKFKVSFTGYVYSGTEGTPIS
ncbi:MAG: prepilin-type N-terminal cleavage/methylation domain-containing protein [Candidatus Peribacteria bacterium]|jgi:prepilin-type N-terminal cleavage/methylation domain-containing protein|nr:prepilin-type N-terminal cleavage/methylation domain-containing protein [Candidatus Peribacteria bacterium]